MEKPSNKIYTSKYAPANLKLTMYAFICIKALIILLFLLSMTNEQICSSTVSTKNSISRIKDTVVDSEFLFLLLIFFQINYCIFNWIELNFLKKELWN